MMSSQPANLFRASLVAGLILALVGCSATRPQPLAHFAQPLTIRIGPQPPPDPPAVLCLLSTDRRCSTLFPEPPRACLTNIERCPREGKFEPLTDHR